MLSLWILSNVSLCIMNRNERARIKCKFKEAYRVVKTTNCLMIIQKHESLKDVADVGEAFQKDWPCNKFIFLHRGAPSEKT